MSLEYFALTGELGMSPRKMRIMLQVPGERDADVIEKVAELFQRLLGLSNEAQKVQVKKNAREHFNIDFG